ncbi:MAG: hypothetical protein R3E53_22050 [Myxococcota bacterium]
MVKTFAEKQGAERAVDAIEAVSDIMIETREGSGLIHSLIFEPYHGGGAESVAKSSPRSTDPARKCTGDGLLHQLIYEPTDTQGVLDQALAASGSPTASSTRWSGRGHLAVAERSVGLRGPVSKILLGGAYGARCCARMIKMAVEQGEEAAR